MYPLEKNKDLEVVNNDTAEIIENLVVVEEEVQPEVIAETLPEEVPTEEVTDALPEEASIKEVADISPNIIEVAVAEEVIEEPAPVEVAEEAPEVAEPEVTEELVPAVEIVSRDSDDQVVNVLPDMNLLSMEELVSVLKDLLVKDDSDIRDQVEHIKQSFYKKLKAENEESKRSFIEDGGLEEAFVPVKNIHEDELKSLLNEYRVKRAAQSARIEAERENNLLQKKHILERMEVLVASSDDVSTHINEFRDLQKKWKSIGQVPASEVNELWKKYTALQESFWDLIKINNELREYDFKKNYEAKLMLCEVAEKLDEEKDVVTAFHQLQKMHEEWREIGPVSREQREEIWNRFKLASSVINKKHQGHFDEIRKLEDDNLQAKLDLCEKLDKFDYTALNNYKAWDEATHQIMLMQEEWRAIGFAPRKINHKVFDRYRAACDAFFNAKAAFYKESKNSLNDNLDKKKALCEKAEALMNDQNWKETSEAFIQMQKEWKTIGPVAKKFSDDIWKRFIAACDFFFEQKQKNTTDTKSVEQDNLLKKKSLIEKINALNVPEIPNPQDVLNALREYIAQWNEIGFVPFREKDKIYKEYRAAVDKMFEMLNVDSAQRRLDNFKSNIKGISANKGENQLYREREKLMRAYEHLKSEIATYENNIGFLSTKNKKGSGVIREMERKIEALKEEAKLIEQKVGLIEETL